MNSETLYERIKRLSNIPIKQLESELGLKDGLIQKWKQSKPRIDNFSLVAKRLGVSMEYLWSGKETETAIVKRPSYSIVGLDKLLEDERYLDISKVYAGAPSDDAKSFLKGAFIQIAKNSGMDTVPIIGY